MESSHYETQFDELHSAAAARIRTDTPTRNHVLELGVLVGNLCSSFLAHAPLDSRRKPLVEPASTSFWKLDSAGRQQIANAMGHLLWALVLAAETCDMNLRDCILKKMMLNQKKYPVDLVKGKAGKYTAYSDQTGITKTEGQSTLETRVESLRYRRWKK